MWLYFLRSLRDHLQNIEALKDAKIYVGSSKKHINYPYIELVRGNISGVENHGRVIGGTYELYVDFWVRNDSPDQEPSYDKLHCIEAITEPEIYNWFKKLAAEKNLAVIAEITDMVSDSDEFRPLCASRFVIKIKYKITGGR